VELMDTALLILGSLRVILVFLLLVFIPGFALSLVIFPRLTELGIFDRLVYSAVLSITSAITLLLFMEVVPGLEPTLENLTLVAGVFSAGALMFWLCERWYLKRRIIKHPKAQLSEDSLNHQGYYSREINAAKDLFRQDTRTVVVYHESERLSGMNFVNHSYLMDVAEEIDIQQVVENKLKVTGSFFLESPSPKTRYFELIIREYNEGPFSQVDDLQIYPVLVSTKPDTKFPGTILQRDTLHITERIYTKTSTEEIQWIYSHDFHIFAFIHAEDTLAQMVDRILGILDEIVIAAKSGILIHSSAGDRQILRSPFDAVSKKPRSTAVKTPEIPQRPDVQPVVQPRDKTRRPVILPSVQDEKIPGYREGHIGTTTTAMPERPSIQTRFEPKKIPKRQEIQSQVLPVDRQKLPVLQTIVEPKTIPTRTEVQPHIQSKKNINQVENKVEVASVRKLQKNILRDLNMFDLTPDSFRRTQKNMEHIQIPKNSDVNKKLSEAEEEMMDLDWIYE
jgi:hypothetical protein